MHNTTILYTVHGRYLVINTNTFVSNPISIALCSVECLIQPNNTFLHILYIVLFLMCLVNLSCNSFNENEIIYQFKFYNLLLSRAPFETLNYHNFTLYAMSYGTQNVTIHFTISYNTHRTVT